MTTSIYLCDPDKFEVRTNESQGVYYPTIVFLNNNASVEVRILLIDYPQLESLIATLKTHYEDFVSNEPKAQGA